MKVELKHIHKTKKRLADGTVREYHRHRLTKKRIYGEPGTDEYIRSYLEACKEDHHAPQTVAWLISEYKRSRAFSKLRDKTRADYDRHLETIQQKFGTMPVKALEEPGVRTVLLNWRDSIGERSPRQADYIWSVLRRLLEWAYDYALISVNHARGGGRLYRSDRSERIWMNADIEAFLAVAPIPVRHAFLIALYTGQRQGDLLSLTWTAFDGQAIRLRQSKTGRKVFIPCGPDLKMLLQQLDRKATTILTSQSGLPWRADNFRHQFAKARKDAGMEGLTFHDLRGTFVTRRSEDGWTPQEIASITGHSMSQVETILDRYLARTEDLATGAMKKMRHGG